MKMKNTILLGAACALLAAGSASADVSFGISMGEPQVYPVAPVRAYPAYPAYVEPGPGYAYAPDWPSEHYDRHRHRHNDYWARRQEHFEHERYEHEYRHG